MEQEEAVHVHSQHGFERVVSRQSSKGLWGSSSDSGRRKPCSGEAQVQRCLWFFMGDLWRVTVSCVHGPRLLSQQMEVALQTDSTRTRVSTQIAPQRWDWTKVVCELGRAAALNVLFITDCLRRDGKSRYLGASLHLQPLFYCTGFGL